MHRQHHCLLDIRPSAVERLTDMGIPPIVLLTDPLSYRELCMLDGSDIVAEMPTGAFNASCHRLHQNPHQLQLSASENCPKIDNSITIFRDPAVKRMYEGRGAHAADARGTASSSFGKSDSRDSTANSMWQELCRLRASAGHLITDTIPLLKPNDP
ncbi:unnamed protein product, partial [Protopolystoma xenopodis]